MRFQVGKSALLIARFFVGKERNFAGGNFWVRRYFLFTVGLDEATPVDYTETRKRKRSVMNR